VARAIAVHARTGYVPGEAGLWERMTGAATIVYLARLRDHLDHVARAHTLAERLELDLSRRVGTLSKGNKQKLVLVQAFMSEPDLVVLDEPTTGLDPLMQQEFHAMVRETTARGATVLPVQRSRPAAHRPFADRDGRDGCLHVRPCRRRCVGIPAP
jgi:ABC-2 type transport system ATP-binding protein